MQLLFEDLVESVILSCYCHNNAFDFSLTHLKYASNFELVSDRSSVISVNK